MKPDKANIILAAIELTKLARGPVPAPPAVTLDPGGNVILSVQQELEDRTCWRIFTEFYCALDAAYDDETVFKSPVTAPPIGASPGSGLATVAGTVKAAAPVVAGVVSAAVPAAAPVANAIAAALALPLGAVAGSPAA